MTATSTLAPVPSAGAAAVSTRADRDRRLDVADLADRLAVEGVAAHADALRELAARGCDAGVAPAVLAVLVDDAAPEVVRLRAFARVAAALTR